MANPLAQAVKQPQSDDRFTRSAGRSTRDDLEAYAKELNAGPMKGWFINIDKQGRAFLDRR